MKNELNEPMESQMRAGIPISLGISIIQKEALKKHSEGERDCESEWGKNKGG